MRMKGRGFAWLACAALPIAMAQAQVAPPGYAEPGACATCHQPEAETYRKTGMGRSFYTPKPSNQVEDYSKKNTYYHKASDTYFEMAERAGKYFQREYQLGPDGKQTNVREKQIDYIVGSGNHSRTYLSRTAKNTLIELPLAWYPEKGGYWAMNPGYDRPDHQGFRRNIGYDCTFCHNAYPDLTKTPPTHSLDAVFPANLPEGIDCQRCHGPGLNHVQTARKPGARKEDIRSTIVNPAKLTTQRQMDVCRQCHLETSSSPLPDSIVRYERTPFSYKPGEPLQDFKIFFDRKGESNRVEIASAASRLDKSACLLKSDGKLTCTTCHNPHDIKHGAEGAQHYTAVCRTCHAGDFTRLVAENKHTSSTDCVGCHMPKRRADDVVHAVITDHYIQRHKPARDLLADIPESEDKYRGEVVLYYPRVLPKPEDELYLATAQVIQDSNLTQGIARLSAAIEKFKPERSEHYLQLADALRRDGKCKEALRYYAEARQRDPNSTAIMEKTALCSGSTDSFIPEDAKMWTQLGTMYLEQGKAAPGISALEKAIELDPELPEAWNDLGGALQTANPARAETALRTALRLQPNYAEAHNNLGGLLAMGGHFDEARYHFEAALRYKADYNFARYNYGIALARANHLPEAVGQFETILKNDPQAADTHEVLGVVLANMGQRDRAIEHYREAIRIRPDFQRANLTLGAALAEAGERSAALPYLNKASHGTDKAAAEEARQLLQQIEKPR